MAKRRYDVATIRSQLRSCFPSIVPAHTPEGHFYKREDTGRVAASVTTKLGFVAKGYLYKWYAKLAAEHVRTNLKRLIEGDLAVLDEAQHAGERSRDNSAGIGTTAHGAIDAFCTEWIKSGAGRPEWSAVRHLAPEAKGEEIAACRSFDKFLDEHEIIPLASELQVWYEVGKDCYAGTIDSIILSLEVYKERAGSSECKHDYAAQPSGIFWCAVCGRETKARLILGDVKTSNTIKGKNEYAHQTEAYARAVEKAVGYRFDAIWIMRFEKSRADYEILKIGNRKQAWKEWIAISRAYDRSSERVGELLVPLTVKEVIKI